MPIFSKNRETLKNLTFYETCLGGCTCDSSDFVIKNCFMPELEIGEYLILENMGSYTKTYASYFNDITRAQTIFLSTNIWSEIKHFFNECDNHDGLVSNKFSLFELEENTCDEDTNYEEILDRIFLDKQK